MKILMKGSFNIVSNFNINLNIIFIKKMFFQLISIHSTDILSKRFLSEVISLKGNNKKCNEGNF